ncbi:MAG: MBOAT family protein [Coriobacteriia bacterium]|nr:MBOAT family protein [Coriobacteriia bacterium]MBN2847316.1 MBOAT family protein [Coriobacteriia bacterium]
MAFNSMTFLFAFLPFLLLVYFLARGRGLRNGVLVLASLIFYAAGGTTALLALIASIIGNYGLGLGIEAARARSARSARLVLSVGVLANVGLLGYFKYSGFVIGTLIRAFGLEIQVPSVVALTGVSFFTFLGISYLVDIYRERALAARNPLDAGLYIADFATLLAGPIVRWEDFAPQVRDRQESVPTFAEGAERFIIGLGKKAILAGGLAALNADVFAVRIGALSVLDAWLGAIAYTLQIYFDFSGYSDMAIGLGLMFGIRLPENFRWPYVATSITDFWRRWHMSLSRWFRDYVYIPLGGSRVGNVRLVLNLFIVWGLTGLWHGAAWVFVAWGLYYGALLVVEKLVLGARIERIWRPMRHGAVLVAVIVGWVIFSAPGVYAALDRLQVMFGLAGAPLTGPRTIFYLVEYRFDLLVGIILSMPVGAWVAQRLERAGSSAIGTIARTVRPVGFALVFALSIAFLVSTSYQPFIYFKF